MLNSNQIKLLRTGGVRIGAHSRGNRSGHFLATPDKLVPNFEELGHQPFTEEHAQALAQRLQAPDWPRGTLNIYGLEGLLTALLVLPLCIRPTVWLPLIWNESGWKIPVALQSADQLQPFLELLGGFMRSIDADLRAAPSRSTSVLEKLATRHRPSALNPQRDWAQGFGLAISQSNYLTVPVDEMSSRALYAIAIHAKPQLASTHQPNVVAPGSFREAIVVLAKLRTSRGPLGALI
jgi:yecA family protein